MVQVSIRSAVIAAVLTLVGCAGPTGDPQKSASKTLGVEGGQVLAPNGVGVTIPSGALRRSVTISLTPASVEQVRPATPAVGDMYEFGPEGQTFDVPAKVKLEVDIARLPAGYSIADVIVLRAPVGSSAFEAIPTRIVDSTHVEADTLHFSVFVPTLGSARGVGGDGGTDGGVDGGSSCSERCVSPNDAGADCECSKVCGQETFEIQCSGASPLGCACVHNGVQVGFVTALMCPAAGDIDRLCSFSVDAGVVTDGGFPDGGTDGGFPDGGVNDGGVFDGGTDGGVRPDGGVDGGFPDAGTDGGFPDGGADGGVFDGGAPDAGFDGGTDAGTSDAGIPDAGRDAGP